MKTDIALDAITDAQTEYNTTYAAELQLNETFHTFVSNFRRAYQGPNNAASQIGSKYSTGTTLVALAC